MQTMQMKDMHGLHDLDAEMGTRRFPCLCILVAR